MIEQAPDNLLPGMVPTATQETATVVEQRKLARDTYLVRIAAPELAAQILPGQFLMIRALQTSDPLLGRPFAVYDTYLDAAGRPAGIDVVYAVIGKMTGLMSRWTAGEQLQVWGPLGNGFPLPAAGRLMMVAGGIGQTPFLAVGQEALGQKTYGQPLRQPEQLPSAVTLCYGARSAQYLAGLEDFQRAGIEVRVATDDGSQGHHGFVTDLLKQALDGDDPPTVVYCCGPEPMMHAVSEIIAAAGVRGFVSLESPMACGFGACFSCVTRVRMDDGEWDYRRTCVEGPVFPADRIVF
ncbi:dihydroorotate dehydrogenase electron transfer subunit [Symmachiella dynata]|uniref:dihydroorotate dehydrogenase electron transfer subunit n=1 Tax=Symmachiella dynata TaxID=2527995 RepID=UPI0030EEFF06